jgi:hypothetical protein
MVITSRRQDFVERQAAAGGNKKASLRSRASSTVESGSFGGSRESTASYRGLLQAAAEAALQAYRPITRIYFTGPLAPCHI